MDWDGAYKSRQTPWDKGAPSPGLVDLLEAAPMRGRVLVPGCGLGHDVRAIAAQPRVNVVGVDISPTALARARRFKTRGREVFLNADLFGLPRELRGVFDWVWEHTCFCAIPMRRRKDYVSAIRSALKKGGELAAIFFLDPGLPDPEAGPPFGVTKRQLNSLFLRSGAFELVHEWDPERAYPGREGRELMRVMRAI
jgi:SAM-dependent methyltransferase